jgi:hypothetical protein
MFSGQPHRQVTSDNLYCRFEKLLKNTASFPITRCQLLSPMYDAFVSLLLQRAAPPRYGVAASGSWQQKACRQKSVQSYIFLQFVRSEMGDSQGRRRFAGLPSLNLIRFCDALSLARSARGLVSGQRRRIRSDHDHSCKFSRASRLSTSDSAT